MGGINAFQLWSKPLPGMLNFTAAALVLNQLAMNLSMALPMADVPGLRCGGSCLVRNVWNRTDFLQNDSEPIALALRPHQGAVLLFMPAGKVVAQGSDEARALLASVAGRSIFDELPGESVRRARSS